jgi:DUF1365 family protein
MELVDTYLKKICNSLNELQKQIEAITHEIAYKYIGLSIDAETINQLEDELRQEIEERFSYLLPKYHFFDLQADNDHGHIKLTWSILNHYGQPIDPNLLFDQE